MPGRDQKPRRPLLAFPYPHFMAFAPLDVWLRILFWPAAWCPPRYWVRLAAVLFTSFLGTVATLPERLLLGPLLRVLGRRSGMRLDHKPGVVVILGYFRSGTTHLHYLLSCDPNVRTPVWCETLAPQGFLAMWMFLRVFMIPWIGSKRPQDDMAMGPSWPAEDDFAQNNAAAASSLPWRFVVPSRHAHYCRFHSLEGLTPREKARWRFHQFAFCWKIARLAGKRVMLLKSPSHLARVRELLDVFGSEGVKFIHISREPRAVIESNVAMFRRMAVFGLQDRKPDEEVRELITSEYVRSEQNYLRDLSAIRPGHVTEIRYEDLVADPIGQLKRMYADLSMSYSQEFEEHVLRYLNAVKDYRAATTRRIAGGSGNTVAASGTAQVALDQVATRFGHDRPPVPTAPLPPGPCAGVRCEKRAMGAACVAAIGAALAWLAVAYFLRGRFTYLIWPTGGVIGLAAIGVAGTGSKRLGLVAAALTLVVLVVVPVPVAFLEDYIHRPYYWVDGNLIPFRRWEWDHIFAQAREGLLVAHTLFWSFMGAGTAYRFASRRFVRPPGTW